MATYTSEVQIGNSALVKVGGGRIASFDDAGKAAAVLKRQYPIQRNALLESYNWTFSIGRATLSADATAPAFGFSYRMLLPADCLRFVGIYDGIGSPNSYGSLAGTNAPGNYSGSKILHKIEGRFLMFDSDTAMIFYIREVTNVTEFSPLFGEALALKLAVDIGYDLSAGAQRIAQLEGQLEQTINKAQLTQAIQGTAEIMISSEFVDAHNGEADYTWPWAYT